MRGETGGDSQKSVATWGIETFGPPAAEQSRRQIGWIFLSHLRGGRSVAGGGALQNGGSPWLFL